jgi:hypothetical protein
MDIIKESFHKVGFWFLIIFLTGFISGTYFAQKMIIERKLSEAVKLEGIVIHDQVYSLKPKL